MFFINYKPQCCLPSGPFGSNFGSGLSALSCMKTCKFRFLFFFFPLLYSRSRDGITLAVLPVWRAAVILNPHFRQTPNQNWETPVPGDQTLSPPTGPPETDTFPSSLPQWSAALSFFPPHQFFYSHALLCRACSFTRVHYSFLPAHWQRKRWRGWTDDNSSRDEKKTWKTTTENVIFFRFLTILCQPVSSFAMIQLLISVTEIICSQCTNSDLDFLLGL